MSVDWDRIGQSWFDRIVEVLIKRRYRDADSVIAVNGRGGDGGIDIEVRQGNRLRIFQLKYFPEGFSGGFAQTRRKQIRRSYDSMLKDKPYEWVLVVPNNVIPSERTFVGGLGKTADAPRHWRIIGRLELDDLLIDFPEVDKWAQRNVTSQLREDAQLYDRERSSLLGPADLGARVGALGELADSADLDWTFDFHRVGNTVSQVLRAQHPGAHLSSPVSLRFQPRFGPEHAQLEQRFRRKLGFGTADTVELPPEVVQDIEIAGPAPIAQRFDSGYVVIGRGPAAPGVGLPLELHFLDEDDTLVASHEGRITNLGAGPHGMSVKTTFYDQRLTVELTFAGTAEQQVVPPEANVSHGIYRARPRVVAEVLAFVRQMRAARRLEVFINGDFALSVRSDANLPADEQELRLEAFATDLDIVQQHCQQRFAFPDTISEDDRVAFRVARIVIEGGIVASPEAGTVTATVPREDYGKLRALLESGKVPVAFKFDYTVSLGNRVLPIGPAWVFHPAATTVDTTTVLAALDAGEGDSVSVDFQPGRDPFFFIASAELPPDRLDDQLETLWQLDGITQPRQNQLPADERPGDDRSNVDV
ncbi:hypothetical protein [Nocardia africana]|uniref:Uncharacterized protein n=1 Tax=Nocardia africana TaxID=134964 RepID=A0A378X331_9NOCA|nr:hypothetical protein [Nocardia africana]MCC3318366.1 hypothetical protein [Nocardia africana]SUA47427.1 Uncharacterised protein [Nocardia africana]